MDPKSGRIDKMRNESDTRVVAVVAIPGSPLFELAVPCEVFGTDRSDLTMDYALKVCPTTPQTQLAGGFIAQASGSLDDLVTADTVIVPGCTSVHHAAPPALIAALRQAAARGARIASICSGAFVLAEAGLLDGLRATTHWMHTAELARRYPQVEVVESVLYVQQDRIWTSAGTAAGIDLCLELVRQDHGSAVAHEVARRMVVPPHRAGAQAQVAQRPIRQPAAASDEQVLLSWARQHLSDSLTVADITKHSGLSYRTLVRRFKATIGVTPQQWLTHERIRAAQELLETSDLPMNRIAAHVGFGTDVNMRIQFNRALGVTPTAYRRSFAR
jgi:AraC family transcriptional activator FtrA